MLMPSEFSLESEGDSQFEIEGTRITKGYFRVDHQVFQDERIRQLSGDCFRIFLWMSSRAWRFPASRGFLRASISMIHLNTGVSEATVSRGLSELKKANLIVLHKVDRKAGNWWWVEPVFQIPQMEGRRGQFSQSEGSVPPKRGNGSFKLREKIPKNDRDLRIINEEIDEEKEEALLHRKAWIEFEKWCPQKENRQKILESIISKEFTGLFKPPQKVMENLAVRKWFEEIF